MEGGSISDVISIVTQFFSQFTALAAVIAGSFLFLIPVAIKFTGIRKRNEPAITAASAVN